MLLGTREEEQNKHLQKLPDAIDYVKNYYDIDLDPAKTAMNDEIRTVDDLGRAISDRILDKIYIYDDDLARIYFEFIESALTDGAFYVIGDYATKILDGYYLTPWGLLYEV